MRRGRFHWRRGAALSAGAALALALWGGAHALAQSQPIKSARDAACRDEARARVFHAPDPHGLGLYAVGKRIYEGCMARGQARQRRSRRAG